MGIGIGTRLGPYLRRAAIGAGAQGDVYKAVDTTLDRAVVIKVLPEEHTVKSYSGKRFRREAKLAASLDHPNICTIHGLYEEGSVRYITMQYVEGKTVRQLVAGHPLELGSALAIAIQTAEALAAAHARGIIHRDIKAANVMVTDAGLVKVLDFGLAKLLEGSGEDTDDQHLTELGVPYGTATYAAPEQAKGGLVDHRADIFSTGVLLYEMLTGTWPFKGNSAVEVRYAVLHGKAKPLAEARAEDSPFIVRLQQILDRALAKEPADRYQQVEELRDDMRAVLKEVDPEASQAVSFTGSGSRVPPRFLAGVLRQTFFSKYKRAIIGGVAAALLAATIGAIYLTRARKPGVESLAVLPFANADPATEYLSDGITESLINSLAQLPAIKVRSRNSVFNYKGREANPETIGRDLGVGVVVAGAVQKRGDSLSVSVELIDTKDDSHIWGQRYTHSVNNLLTLQAELSRDITRSLRLRLTSAEQQQLVKNYATNSEAYELYLQGRYYWNKRTAEGLNKGIEYFQQAIEKDPGYALAYVGLAESYAVLSFYGDTDPKESFPKAKAAATSALQLDEMLGEAHASLGFVHMVYDWDWSGAEKEFKHAIEFNPNYASAWHWYGWHLTAMGRFDEAAAKLKRAQELEPLSQIIGTSLGEMYYYARQYDRAIEQLLKTLQIEKNFAQARMALGRCYLQKGDFSRAIAELSQARAISGETAMNSGNLGYAYAVSGQREQARKMLGEIREMAKQHYVSSYYVALIYVGLGEKDQGLEWLSKAQQEGSEQRLTLKVDPRLDSLRSDPRFQELLRNIGFAP